MDKLKLRYLIREAIENVAGITAKFSVGDKVTTVDGDTATVTMAEHPFYTVELEATGTTKSYSFKDLAPFQEKVIAKHQRVFRYKKAQLPLLVYYFTKRIKNHYQSAFSELVQMHMLNFLLKQESYSTKVY